MGPQDDSGGQIDTEEVAAVVRGAGLDVGEGAVGQSCRRGVTRRGQNVLGAYTPAHKVHSRENHYLVLSIFVLMERSCTLLLQVVTFEVSLATICS